MDISTSSSPAFLRRPPSARHTPYRTAALVGLVLALTFCGDPSVNAPPPGDPPPADLPPQAAFTASCDDLSCTFIDESTDPSGTIMTRSWNFSDGSATSETPSHTFASAGTYPVTLTVTDDGGADDSITHEVSVSIPIATNAPPTAHLVANCSALNCSFTDASSDSDGTIASRSWNFGDGATATDATPAHTYAGPGTYPVSLTVADNGGANSSMTENVIVQAAQAADPILIGGGDLAGCAASYKDRETAALIAQYPGATVFTAGDNAYPDGTAENYSQCYARSWGAFKDRTHPAPGNHDYHVSGAPGYFGYFGAAAGPAGRGYYSYDLGTWHIISLNSETDVGGTSPQANWLRQDLAAHPATCTLAYWHKPLFSSGVTHAPTTAMQPLFTILYEAGADVVLMGHNHHYERFAPQRPEKVRDEARGIRAFVVGSGGAALYGFATPQPNSVVRHQGWGVLKLTLKASSYTWEFLPIAGSSFTDTGTGECH